MRLSIDGRKRNIGADIVQAIVDTVRQIDRGLTLQRNSNPDEPLVISKGLALTLADLLEGIRLDLDASVVVEITGGVANVSTTCHIVHVIDHDSQSAYLQHYDLQTPLKYKAEPRTKNEEPAAPAAPSSSSSVPDTVHPTTSGQEPSAIGHSPL